MRVKNLPSSPKFRLAISIHQPLITSTPRCGTIGVWLTARVQSLEADPDSVLTATTLYSEYVNYCAYHSLNHVGMTEFLSFIPKMTPGVVSNPTAPVITGVKARVEPESTKEEAETGFYCGFSTCDDKFDNEEALWDHVKTHEIISDACPWLHCKHQTSPKLTKQTTLVALPVLLVLSLVVLSLMVALLLFMAVELPVLLVLSLVVALLLLMVAELLLVLSLVLPKVLFMALMLHPPLFNICNYATEPQTL
jgi:hypothetical protein